MAENSSIQDQLSRIERNNSRFRVIVGIVVGTVIALAVFGRLVSDDLDRGNQMLEDNIRILDAQKELRQQRAE